MPTTFKERIFVDLDTFESVDTLNKILSDQEINPKATIWLTNYKMRNNGTLGMAKCLVEENPGKNRFRVLSDISLKKENRMSEAKFDVNDKKVKEILEMDLHANYYQDGAWGSIRHVVIEKGKI